LPWAEPDEWPGPECYCGKAGCIETFLSGPALARAYEGRTGHRERPARIAALADEGEAHAAAVLDRYEHRMARALAGVLNVLDPDVVVLGGGMSNIARLYPAVSARWLAYVFGAVSVASGDLSGDRAGRLSAGTAGSARVRTRLVRAAHGDSSGVRGAAWLWPE
jgi:fructokinase